MNEGGEFTERKKLRKMGIKRQEIWQQMLKDNMKKRNLTLKDAQDGDKWSCCCYLPDPFRGMGTWRKTMEPQKPGNSPESGPEVVKRQRAAKE